MIFIVMRIKGLMIKFHIGVFILQINNHSRCLFKTILRVVN